MYIYTYTYVYMYQYIYIYVYRSIYRLIPPFFFISRICMMHVSPTASTKAGGTDLKATQSYPGLMGLKVPFPYPSFPRVDLHNPCI